MKLSIDNIINEFALHGLKSQNYDFFIRHVANAINGHPKESMSFGRIIKFSLKGENGTAIRICFEFEAVNTNGNHCNGKVNLTVCQDGVYIDAFDYIVD